MFDIFFCCVTSCSEGYHEANVYFAAAIKADAAKFYKNYIFIMFISSAGKVLIIGGSIANFTNVAATFKVIS